MMTATGSFSATPTIPPHTVLDAHDDLLDRFDLDVADSEGRARAKMAHFSPATPPSLIEAPEVTRETP